jgi:hypothetical protein
VALLVAMSVVAAAAENPAPLVPDDEEYAVFAAVLFPPKPEVPANVPNEALFMAQYRDRVRLDGVLANDYTIAEETAPGSPLKPDSRPESSDAALIIDYNTKNTSTYRIDGDTLARLLPGRRIRMLQEDVRQRIFRAGGWEAYRATVLGAGSGIVWLSRVGFNTDRTRAAVHIRHQADYEMGVAYRVFLEKSPKTGTWLLSSTVMTRRS